MYTFKKEERLTGNAVIDELFAKGKSKMIYPYKVIWKTAPDQNAIPVKIMMSVSKRVFKKAVDRNKLRRRMKEAYRLNKEQLVLTCNEQHRAINVAIIYIAKEKQDYDFIKKKMIKVLQELSVNNE